MADRVYLSIWLRDFSPQNMLEHWRRVLEAFPVSASAPGASLSIYPFDWSETPVFERSFTAEAEAEDLTRVASEFLHDDYAYEAEMRWDLWLPAIAADGNGAEPSAELQENLEEGGEAEEMDPAVDPQWRRAPTTVALACIGPSFEPEEHQDRAHIRINFGLDAPFLPMEEDEAEEAEIDMDEADVRGRENLQQLVEFVHRLDAALPISKRVLWCESGENLAEKITSAWRVRL